MPSAAASVNCASAATRAAAAVGQGRAMSEQPVGVFDSGVGGLSVLREIRHLLPAESLLYVADSGFVPYGEKPPELIIERSCWIADFLLSRGAKALVLACNTATAAAVGELRARYGVPIVGMEPAVKPATLATQTGVVGVLATTGTLRSARFAALLDRFAGSRSEEHTSELQSRPHLVCR